MTRDDIAILVRTRLQQAKECLEDAREAVRAAGDFVQSIESILNSQGYKL